MVSTDVLNALSDLSDIPYLSTVLNTARQPSIRFKSCIVDGEDPVREWDELPRLRTPDINDAVRRRPCFGADPAEAAASSIDIDVAARCKLNEVRGATGGVYMGNMAKGVDLET